MSLVDKVVEVTKAATPVNADGSPLTEAQNAAILIAQVQAIIEAETVTMKPESEA
jgi:hypothetical protein